MSNCEVRTRSFDGESYEPRLDSVRLTRMQDRVLGLMADGEWRLPEDIRKALELPEGTAITSRLRDLRKRRFGAFTVERRRTADESGRFEYRVVIATRVNDKPADDVRHEEE